MTGASTRCLLHHHTLTQVPEGLFTSLNTFPLMAIPFFVPAAYTMNRGGISKRLTDLGNAMVGHNRGGRHLPVVAMQMLFGAACLALISIQSVPMLWFSVIPRRMFQRDLDARPLAVAEMLSTHWRN